jgi:hypothetical protein
VTEIVLDRPHRELVEAVHCVRGIVKNLEETANPGESQHRCCSGRDRRKFDVAIALHGFFQNPQQHVNSGAVEMPHSGTVEHHPGPVSLQVRLDFAKKFTAVGKAQLLRQMSNRY